MLFSDDCFMFLESKLSSRVDHRIISISSDIRRTQLLDLPYETLKKGAVDRVKLGSISYEKIIYLLRDIVFMSRNFYMSILNIFRFLIMVTF